jgi:hypothetical protein
MKIHIELNENTNIAAQLSAVNIYIDKYSTKTYEKNDFSGFQDVIIKLEETKKNNGIKIESDVYTPFHVSCKKTKSGLYKFKVWNA